MTEPTVWQIGAGEAGRRYDDLFLQHDVMFCGPSEFGPFSEADYKQVVAKGVFSAHKIAQVRAFATQVKPHDVVLLRSGYRVVAIGIVADDGYAHNPTFDDVFGWDVEHTHRVIWQSQLANELDTIQKTGDLFADRKQVPTFTSVSDPKIISRISHLLTLGITRLLNELPAPPPPPLNADKLSEALFARGLAYETVDRVHRALAKQKRLLEWYWSSGYACGRPTDHEVVAHLILPLMLALGWSEQLLAVEWHKIDMAAFWTTPTTPQNCKMICEAKAMGHGLQNILKQAKDYIDALNLTDCDKIMLADGGRFYLYRRDSGVWSDKPVGYVNVTKIREDHVCPKGTNAVDTIIALTPAHVAK